MVKTLPLWGKLLYGVPPTGFYLINHTLTAYIFFFYAGGASGDSPLIPPAIIGTVMFLGRIVDAITDPIIARYSDNLDSPYGRRIPFMAVSGILLSVSFIALFHPPLQQESVWNVVYLVLFLSLYFTIYTGYVTPYLALLPELARTTKVRVDLSTFKGIFAMVGTGAGLILSGILIDSLGFKQMSWVIGAAALIFLYAPIAIREKEYAHAKPATMGIVEAVKATLQNRPFLLYLIGCIAFWFGGNIVLQSAPFYISVLLNEGPSTTSLFYGAAGGVAVISFPIINYLAKRWGLKAMMLICMLILTIILPLFFFIGYAPFGLNPIIAALIVVSIAGAPIACLFIVPDALVAAISDLDERRTGQRREAMYFGTQGLIMKVALGFSSLVMGGLLGAFGQTPDQPLGVQLTGPVAAVFVLIGFIIFTRYPEKEVVDCEQKETVSTACAKLTQ